MSVSVIAPHNPRLTAGVHLFLSRFDMRAERYWAAGLIAIIALALTFVCMLAATRPLDHDEIYTFYVASQSSLSNVYSVLLDHADNHPPLDYWLRHLSMQILGRSELGFRFPSILAFTGTLWITFLLMRRYWGAAAGLAAVAVIVASQATSLAYFARSYSLVLFWSVAALWVWDQAVNGEHRRQALVLLALLFATAPLLHFYAPFHIAAVVMAELARTYRRRSVDFPVWAAFACWVAALPIIWPLLAYARSFSNGFWTPVTLQAALEVYPTLFIHGIASFFAVLALWTLLKSTTPTIGPNPIVKSSTDPLPVLLAGVYLCALPMVIFLVARSTGALQAKYAISFVFGVAILSAFAAAQSLHLRVIAACALAVFSLSVVAGKALASVRQGQPGPPAAVLYAVANKPDLPIVLDSSQTFVSSAHYAAPAVRARLFYLTDREAALRIQHQDVDQKALPGLARISSFQAVPREAFLRDHPRFLLVYEGGWLLQRVLEDRARISIEYFERTPLITVDTSPLVPAPRPGC